MTKVTSVILTLSHAKGKELEAAKGYLEVTAII
jgi:hypothetical protein